MLNLIGNSNKFGFYFIFGGKTFESSEQNEYFLCVFVPIYTLKQTVKT